MRSCPLQRSLGRIKYGIPFLNRHWLDIWILVGIRSNNHWNKIQPITTFGQLSTCIEEKKLFEGYPWIAFYSPISVKMSYLCPKNSKNGQNRPYLSTRFSQAWLHSNRYSSYSENENNRISPLCYLLTRARKIWRPNSKKLLVSTRNHVF